MTKKQLEAHLYALKGARILTDLYLTKGSITTEDIRSYIRITLKKKKKV